MYTLEETIAKDYLAQFTYPWEALAGIGDYIKELGKTLNPDVYEQKGEDIWVAKSAAVAPTACLNGPLIIDENAMSKQVRGEQDALYISEKGKSSPTEILETLAKYNVEGRPIWKPMHMQPIYRMNPFITREGNGRSKTNAYINDGYYGKDGQPLDIGNDIFNRGVCLPSDNKMTKEQQDIIIEIIKKCFE